MKFTLITQLKGFSSYNTLGGQTFATTSSCLPDRRRFQGSSKNDPPKNIENPSERLHHRQISKTTYPSKVDDFRITFFTCESFYASLELEKSVKSLDFMINFFCIKATYSWPVPNRVSTFLPKVINSKSYRF